MSDLVLAVDVGTSSVRAALFDVRGTPVPHTFAQRALHVRFTADGAAELDPSALRAAALACLEGVLRAHRARRSRRAQIVGVGVSSFWHGLLGVGASGEPETPIFTWADSRSRKDAARLRAELDESRVHARTGSMLRSSFWPAKLRWLRRTAGALFRRVRAWRSPAEWWLDEMCGGTIRASCSMASGTGLLRVAAPAWDGALLAACRIDPALLGEVDDAPMGLAPRWTARFPELAESVFHPVLGDGAASNLGVGATRRGVAALNFGTSAALRVVTRDVKQHVPLGLFRYRIDARRFVVGGAVSNAGSLHDWCLRELADGDRRTVDRPLAQRTVPRHGLDVLPFWLEERSPTWSEGARGAILGMTQATTRDDLIRSILEASFQRLALVSDRLAGGGFALHTIVLGGGLARSRPGARRLADVLGRSIRVCDEPEASLRGAAVLAWERSGVQPPPPRWHAPLRPEGSLAAHYRAGRKRQLELEKKLLAVN